MLTVPDTGVNVDDTPFTVEVIPLLEVFNALELIMFTPVAATPFTVVVNVLDADEFDILFTAVAVATLPFTVEVIILPVDANVFKASEVVLATVFCVIIHWVTPSATILTI